MVGNEALLGVRQCVARESELIDWMIARPDGTEEGNVVGKFLDTFQTRR